MLSTFLSLLNNFEIVNTYLCGYVALYTFNHISGFFFRYLISLFAKFPFDDFRLHHGSNNNSVWEGVWRHLLIAGGFFWAGAVAASRVYLEYHTLAQVMAGGALGALAACAWFALTHCVFTPLFPYICSWYYFSFSRGYSIICILIST